MNIRKDKLISAALTFVFGFTATFGSPAPARAAMNLTLAQTIASSNFSTPTWTAQGGGFMWVSQNNAVKKIDESSGTVSSVSLTSTPQELSWDGTNMWTMLTNGKIAKIAPNGTVTYSPTTICSSPGNNDSIAASATQIVASCFSTALIVRVNPADASVQESDSGTVSGRVSIAGNYIYATTFASRNMYRFPISSLASATRVTISANLETNHWHRMAADENYIWVTNSSSNANPRVTRITRSNNTVTHITISTAGNYHAIGGVYSDGTTVFITNNTTKKLSTVDIATSTVLDEITYTTMNYSSVAMGANGLWVLADGAMYRYTSSSLTLAAAPTAPDAPTSVSGSPGDSQVALSWIAPASNGGAAISDYLIEYLPSSGSWTTWPHAASSSTSATITGLTNGTSYTFRVSAVNSIGTSPTSIASSSVTPRTTAGAPSFSSITVSDSQATLNWLAPGSNGGAPITDYYIEYRAGSGSWSSWSHTASISTTATITGLTNGTSYTFRVSAINAVGTGPSSTISTSYTPASVPGAPTSVTGTRGNGQVSISWTAPASNGGATISDYLVEYLAASGTWTTWSHPASSANTATVTGLTNGTSYTFRVSAINSVGTGIASLVSSAVIPATTPGTPTDVNATVGNSQVTLSWSAPIATGGSAITDYVIEYQPASGSWTTWSHLASTSTSATITGLLNGTSYAFRVSAKNEVGTGNASIVSNSATPATVPSAPTSVNATKGAGQVSLTWTAPSSNGGSAILDYLIEYRAGNGSWLVFNHTASNATSTIVTGLTNGTSYTFRVSAINSAGTSSASSISSAATPLTTPDSPTNLSVTSGDTEVTLTWDAPVQNGGSAITNYLVEYKVSQGSWTSFSRSATTETVARVTGLSNGSTYTFRVSAVNIEGTGNATSESSAVTPAVATPQPSLGGGTATPTPAPTVPPVIELSPSDKNKVRAAWSPVIGALKYKVTLVPTKGKPTVIELKATELKFYLASSIGVTISVESIDAVEKSTDIFSRFLFTPKAKDESSIRLSSVNNTSALLKVAKSMTAGTSLLVTSDYSTVAQKKAAIRSSKLLETRLVSANRNLIIASQIRKVKTLSSKPISVLPLIKLESTKN